MRIFISVLLLSASLFAASVNKKAVACELKENVESAYFLWEKNGSKGFIKFMTRNQCELLHQGAKVEIVGEEDNYYKVIPINLRELWIRKEVITK